MTKSIIEKWMEFLISDFAYNETRNYTIFIDNIFIAEGNWSIEIPIKIRIEFLDLGQHTLTIYVSDGFTVNGTAIQYYLITIFSGTKPTILSDTPDFMLNNQAIYFEWVIEDPDVYNPYFEIYLNSTYIGTGTWLSNQMNSWSYENFSIGIYLVEIKVYDGYGEIISLNWTMVIATTADDSDNDGLPNGWELKWGFNPLLDNHLDDVDDDGLTNIEEYLYDTNPLEKDGDFDRISDNLEVRIPFGDPNSSLMPWPIIIFGLIMMIAVPVIYRKNTMKSNIIQSNFNSIQKQLADYEQLLIDKNYKEAKEKYSRQLNLIMSLENVVSYNLLISKIEMIIGEIELKSTNNSNLSTSQSSSANLKIEDISEEQEIEKYMKEFKGNTGHYNDSIVSKAKTLMNNKNWGAAKILFNQSKEICEINNWKDGIRYANDNIEICEKRLAR
jgi:hypothetical protein